MGKGDKRSRRGKIFRGSYGKTRRKKKRSKPASPPGRAT
jgi:ribosomal small subunit protein bTHX